MEEAKRNRIKERKMRQQRFKNRCEKILFNLNWGSEKSGCVLHQLKVMRRDKLISEVEYHYIVKNYFIKKEN